MLHYNDNTYDNILCAAERYVHTYACITMRLCVQLGRVQVILPMKRMHTYTHTYISTCIVEL